VPNKWHWWWWWWWWCITNSSCCSLEFICDFIIIYRTDDFLDRMAINPQTGMDVDYTVRATVCPKYQGSWLCNLVCIYRKILVNSRLLLMKLLIKLWSAMPVLWNFMNSASVSQSVKCEVWRHSGLWSQRPIGLNWTNWVELSPVGRCSWSFIRLATVPSYKPVKRWSKT